MILYVFILFFVRVLCDENVTEVTNFVTTDKFVEKIERTVQPLNFSGGLIKGEKKITDFKPSPQLDVEYEYNKFPVVPAHPEAKRSKIQNEYYTSTESTYPWRIKFPAPERERERPYKFYNENEERPSKFYNENEESPSYTSKNFQKNEDISFQKHVPIRQNSYDNIYKEPEEKYSYNMMERPSPIQKTGGEDIMDKTEDLKKIFAAVRHQDCSPITCENIQNPP
ncbi:unnamed protein product [Brassicogethes aeneus]|uniref:Uncharacterized protein n=1 Tax=Brassicogethes aeneus TaxID=1431903 RepID=A0A9P0BCC3_BRAAE|nr:unnamed protein product [Brassicogethes aeneus]